MRSPSHSFWGAKYVFEGTFVNSQRLRELANEIVAAYVSNNSVPASELPALIGRMHGAIISLGRDAASVVAARNEPAVERPSPGQIRKSVHPDGITSFIDGKIYKTLKRHLTSHGLDPVSYRERYGLPDGYPMVAPNYAEKRSAIAKQIGLGRSEAVAEKKSVSSRKVA